jgi:hypothetical protein
LSEAWVADGGVAHRVSPVTLSRGAMWLVALTIDSHPVTGDERLAVISITTSNEAGRALTQLAEPIPSGYSAYRGLADCGYCSVIEGEC